MSELTLTAERIDVDDDIRAFTEFAIERGWGDGLPVVPPTEALVTEFIAASGLESTRSLGRLFPSGADCTVELLAINAVMAGAPASSMPLLAAAVSAAADPAFDLAGINATTASVVPALVVNGDVRNELPIPYQHSALGGMAGPAPAIGRALRLVIRNVAGQVAGKTSESVFGQPGRVTGVVVGEWEERSPWPGLAERRGVTGDAVTVLGVLGSANVLDSIGTNGFEILEVMGKSLAFMGNNNMDHSSQFATQLMALNPIWADKVAADVPRFEDVLQIVFDHATLPIDWFPTSLQPAVEEAGDVKDGKVWLMDSPDDLNIIVCGGSGNLHGTMLPGMSNMLPVTRSLDASTWDPNTTARRDVA